MVGCSHILCKHRGSRNPNSWKEKNISRTEEEALEIIEKHRASLVAQERSFVSVVFAVCSPRARACVCVCVCVCECVCVCVCVFLSLASPSPVVFPFRAFFSSSLNFSFIKWCIVCPRKGRSTFPPPNCMG